MLPACMVIYVLRAWLQDTALACAQHAAHGLSAWLALAGSSLQALAASVRATPDYGAYNATLFSKVAPDLFAMVRQPGMANLLCSITAVYVMSVPKAEEHGSLVLAAP